MDENSRNLQKRYNKLKKALSSHNYTDSFSIDSLSIIEKLFNDLLSAAKEVAKQRQTEEQLTHELRASQTNVNPLRQENKKLGSENARLHADVIQLKEDMNTKQSQFQQQIKEFEVKLENLNYVCQSKDNEMIAVEKERLKMKEAYEKIATSSLLSGGKQIKRAIKSTSTLPSSITTTQFNDNQFNQQQSSSDGSIIETLRHQVEALEHSLQTTETELAETKERLQRKDQEYLKLSMSKLNTHSLMGGDRNQTMDSLLEADRSNQIIIDQLNSKVSVVLFDLISFDLINLFLQVDFLNEKLAERESELNGFKEQIDYLQHRQGEFQYQ